MSASHAAEMIVHHTQAASFHQGKEVAYAEAMRLVRNLKQSVRAMPSAELLAMIERTEETLYDFSKEESARKDAHNRATREADELLTAASNTIRTR